MLVEGRLDILVCGAVGVVVNLYDRLWVCMMVERCLYSCARPTDPSTAPHFHWKVYDAEANFYVFSKYILLINNNLLGRHLVS